MNHVAQAPQGFGSLVAEHRGSARVIGLVAVLVVVLGGLCLLGALTSDEPIVAGIIVAVALGLIGLAQFFRSGTRLRIYEHGIVREGRLGTKQLAWQDLQSYQLQIIDTTVAAGAGAGLLGVLLVALIRKLMGQKSLIPSAVHLLAKDGKKLVLSGSIAGYRDMQQSLVPYLTGRLFAEAKPAYDAGVPLSFGKKLMLQRGVGFTYTGLFGKQYVLPLEQTASATLERAALVIRRSDTNGAWQSLPAAAVLNLGVLQKFIELGGRRYADGLPLAWTS